MENKAYHIIEKKLHSFFKKFYLIELYKGFSLFLFFGFLYFLVAVFIEYFFWLSPQIKKYLFFSVFFILIFFFLVFLLRPLLGFFGLKTDLKSEKAAVLIGNHFPDIQDKLLNIIQLKENSAESELLLASIEQKSLEIKDYDFTKAIDIKKNKKYFYLLLIPFVFLFAIKISGKEKQLGGSYKRLVSYNTYFQAPAPFNIHLLSPSQFTAGDDYHLKISVTGSKVPQQFFLHLQDKKFALFKENDSIYSLELTQPVSSFQFFISGGKYDFGPYFVDIFHPAVIKNAKLTLVYPSYLHLKPEKTDPLSNIKVPEGTALHWNFKTSYADTLFFRYNDSILPLKIFNDSTALSRSAFSPFVYNFSTETDHLTQLLYQVDIIPDKRPQMEIQEKKDSLNNINYYKIQASDDYKLSRLRIHYKKIGDTLYSIKDIPLDKNEYSEVFFSFPIDVFKDSIKNSYEYYFSLKDNYPYNNSHIVSSKKYYYNYIHPGAREDQILEKQKELLFRMNKQQNQFKKETRDIEKLSRKLKSDRALDWQTKQLLEHNMNRQKQMDRFFKESLNKFKNLLEKFPQNKNLDDKKELEKRLAELEEMNKKKQLLDELQKLAEKLDKEGLLKKIDELKNYSKHQEKSLERMLELTKKYYIRQKLNKLSRDLKQLANKQDSLSALTNDRPEDQQKLNEQFDKMKKKMDSLSNLNKSLKTPLKLDEINTGSQDIKQEMQKSAQQLSQNRSAPANNSQKKAASKMKKLSEQMSSMSMSGGGTQKSEDIATLQNLLKSLLNFSFKQENLLNQYQKGNIREQLANHLLDQNKQKTYFKSINDSLYTLALRNPRISQKILDLAYNIETELDLTLENIADLKAYTGAQHSQFVLTYSNALADMISNALDDEKNNSNSSGSGQGKKKGKSFSLPDIIKKQSQSISQMEEALKSKKDSRGKKGKKENGKTGEEESSRQYELYKQQQQIKDALSQLQDKFSSQKDKEQIRRLLRKMDALNKRLLREGITRQSLESLKQIRHELLKLKNASFMQEEEDKRTSRSNNKQFTPPDSLFLKKNTNFAPSNEVLKRNQLPVNQEIKQKIIEYLRHD